MNVTFFAFVVAASLSVSITQLESPVAAAQTQAKKLAVSASFNPNPPSAKGVDKIIVSVKDASGKPVSGAIVKIATSMPTMSMKGAEIVAHDSGHGMYTADAKLNYATKWAFGITANAKGQSGMTHVEKELK